ncbi:MAG: SRPBCC family protein [Proteobacteria bacterium]|nr:MAG: SRPBCC family protein [Pseudomonadota bacterium]
MAGAKHTTTMNVPLEALWEVITNYEEYPEFVEGLQSLTVTKVDGKHTYADYVVSMFGKKIKYSVKHTETPKKGLKWTMTEGEFFKSNDGSWELAADGDDAVEATYSVDVGFPLLVPKSVVNTLTGTQLPKMMKAFEDRAKAKAQKPAKAKAKKAPAKEAAAPAKKATKGTKK